MWQKVGLQIFKQTGNVLPKYTDSVIGLGLGLHKYAKQVNLECLSLASEINCDTVILSRIAKKMKLKNFTSDEILDMKPSEFKKILEARKDIPETIRNGIYTPEKLNLFDEVAQLDEVLKMEPVAREDFLNKLFTQYNLNTSEASAQLEVIPNLIKKGYDPQVLAELRICEYNQDIVEAVLKRADLPEKYAMRKMELFGDELWRYGGERYLDEHRRTAYRDVLMFADKNSLQYIDDCLTLTGSFTDLPYWTKETSEILRKFSPDIKVRPSELLDRLYRNNHTYESVRAIYGDKQMTAVTQRLLEYKNFNKFKDVGLKEFDKLSITDKKEFIKGYVSALTPKELLFPRQHNLEKGFDELQNSMKIYRELNPETTETLVNSYNNTLRSLLNKLPESERNVFRSNIDTKFYRRQYRLDNPIPSLVDELENVLKIETRTVNGRTVKYAEMSRDVEFGISTHRFPCPESILTIEALEEVDAKMLLCVGTKGGTRGMNVGKNSGHALIVKPRKASDWQVQAFSDIDSGNNATKNIFNFEHLMLPKMGNHCGAIDLIPNAIKKELNLSQREYTSRMKTLKDCRTLDEIGKKDPLMEKTIRKVIKEQNLYEGLMRTETMGVTIPENMKLEEVSEDIINYCTRRDIPIVRIIEQPIEPKKILNKSISIQV